MAINCYAAAVALFFIYFGIFSIAIDNAEIYLILWIIASLFFATRSLTSRARNTVEVIDPKCPFCGGTMETSVLRCMECGKPAGEYKS
jgi:hypothetical protein